MPLPIFPPSVRCVMKLTDFGRQTLVDRYLLPGETIDGLFHRVAGAFADDEAHAARLHHYMTNLWFMPATPILSNGGAGRGLPISCFLNGVEDSMAGIQETWNENVSLASNGGGIGCVDADTEFLTPQGWKKIVDYQPGDKVLTVNPSTLEGFFSEPEAYVRAPAGRMYAFTNKLTGKKMVVSDNHRNFVAIDGKSAPSERTTDWLLENERYKSARFTPVFRTEGGDGLPYTDLELRLLVALAADGSEAGDRDMIRFGLRRHRKIARLRWLLDELALDYSCKVEGSSTVFTLAGYGLVKNPLTFEHFGRATKAQLQVIFDELGHWDGTFDQRTSYVRFSTMKVEEADFVQYVIQSVTGNKAGYGTKSRDGEIVVRETSRGTITFSEVEEFEPADGHQYCFQTSTTFWFARREGATFITGNTYWGDVRSVGEPAGKGGKTSGVIPFMKVQDSLTLAVNQGNLRRGSAAVYLDVHHPEVEEFIELRKPTGDSNRRALNLHHGLVIDDAFMIAVREGRSYGLRSPKTGEILRSVDARALWARILDMRLQTGEPYLLWKDTATKAMAPFQLDAGLKVKTSNLCVAPETKILTRQGQIPIGDLEDQQVEVWNGFEWSETMVRKTGINQRLVQVSLSNGAVLDCTPQHHFYTIAKFGRSKVTRVEAKDLKPGMRLIKHFLPVVQGTEDWERPYYEGFFTGDGCSPAEGCNDILYFYGEKRALAAGAQASIPSSKIYDAHTQNRLTLRVKRGVMKPKFSVPGAGTSIDTRIEWLAGLLDSDGAVVRTGSTQALQIGSINPDFLNDVRLMLQTLGVNSKVSLMREAGERLLPDGRGGKKISVCQTIYRLLIGETGLQQLLSLGLKPRRLVLHTRSPNRDASQFVKVVSVQDNGRVSDTFCFNEPKRHLGMFNGVLTGQCVEIMLPVTEERTAVCCLSSVNAETYDEWKDDPLFIEDIFRFLDNVLTDFCEKAPPQMARAVHSVKRERAVGLGLMGFHSLLQKMGVPFESVMAKSWNMRLFKHLRAQADVASRKLAEERGACLDAADAGVMERFSYKLAVAPTASISIICGGTSAGIEPIPANIYTHKTLSGSFVVKNPHLQKVLEEVWRDITGGGGFSGPKSRWMQDQWDSILSHDGSVQHLDYLTEDQKAVFKTAFEIDQRWVVELAADRAPFICQGQSVNVFLPGDVHKADLHGIHWMAWERGVKSLYYLRSKSVQRASHVEATTMEAPKNYEECLVCT